MNCSFHKRFFNDVNQKKKKKKEKSQQKFYNDSFKLFLEKTVNIPQGGFEPPT